MPINRRTPKSAFSFALPRASAAAVDKSRAKKSERDAQTSTPRPLQTLITNAANSSHRNAKETKICQSLHADLYRQNSPEGEAQFSAQSAEAIKRRRASGFEGLGQQESSFKVRGALRPRRYGGKTWAYGRRQTANWRTFQGISAYYRYQGTRNRKKGSG